MLKQVVVDRRGQHFQNVFLGLMVSDLLDRLAKSTDKIWLLVLFLLIGEKLRDEEG